MLPPPPPPRQRLTGRAALRCRYEARCCCCCGRPLPAAALHVPRLGGSSGGGGGGCSRRGGGSTSRAAQPSELLPAFSSPCSPSRPLPAPGFRPRPLLPAPCRRLTRTDTCSPRPRGIRRLVGLLSGAQVAPAALTPARPHARGRPRAPPAEATGSSLTVQETPRRGPARGRLPTSACGPAPSTLTSGCGSAVTSGRGPAPGLVFTSLRGSAPGLCHTAAHGSAPGFILTLVRTLVLGFLLTSVRGLPPTLVLGCVSQTVGAQSCRRPLGGSRRPGDIPPRPMAKPRESFAVKEFRSGPSRDLSSQEREP